MSFGFDYMQSVRRIKVLIIGGSLATLFVLGMEVWREHFSGMWRSHQSRYATMLPEEFRAHFEIGLKQAFLPDLSRVDRCQTCHIGIENPAMKDAELPLRAHSGTLLDKHSPETFGCTVCHQGQGRATWLPDAHGDVPHWEEPLLRGPLVYTSCGRCHVENSPFGEFTEQFGGRVADAEIYVGDLERNIPGATLLGRGKALFLRSGCLGCHVYRGQGGSHAPDLTHVGDKGVHGYDFSHLPPGRERTPLQWLIEHFLDPGAVSPGTVMPDMGVNREEALGLAAYMLSLRSQSVPSRYRAPSMRAKGEPAGGKRLYELFCVACHGKDLAGSQVPEIRTPTLSNADLLSVASDEYLEAIITHGRSGTKMPSWSAGGLTKGQIKRLVTYIRSFERKSAELASVSPHRGDAAFGKALYRGNCANCHGKKGEGGIGTALGSQEFLMMASDEFLARVVVEGRPDSGMPSWKRLSSVEISDILAYIRSWQDTGARKEEVLSRLESGAGRPAHGEDIYQSKCRDCHGTDARGAIGPSLIAKDLISRVSDEYLFHAIRDGRPGTAMPSWTTLTTQEICDLISYLRLASKARYRKVTAPILQGDPANGGLLYRQACESCHGPKGVGGVGPQLANRVFLDHASDRFLYETIGYGLEGTPMRGFLKGSKGGAGIAEFSPTQISDLVAYVKSLRFRPLDRSLVRPVLGNTARGREIYEERGGCVACHGTHGEGALGTALGNPRFLDQVTEGFLIGTMVLGRGGTQMRQYGSWGTAKLSLADFMDVAAYLRTLPSQRPAGPTGSRSFSSMSLIGEGRSLFSHFCSACHGKEGRNGYAPSLNNPEFLAAASDGYLVATIATGRRGTPMRAFGPAGDGIATLTADEIRSIVHYMRSWQGRPGPPKGTSVVQRGEWLVRRLSCFTCHGKRGKGGMPNWNFAGGTIPSLNNLAEKMELYEPEEVKAVLQILERGGTLKGLSKLEPLPSVEAVQAQFERVHDLIHDGKKASKRDLQGPPAPLDMPSFGQVMTASEIDAVIAYCLTLQSWDEDEEER